MRGYCQETGCTRTSPIMPDALIRPVLTSVETGNRSLSVGVIKSDGYLEATIYSSPELLAGPILIRFLRVTHRQREKFHRTIWWRVGTYMLLRGFSGRNIAGFFLRNLRSILGVFF